ncbi:MAG: hypothetical protein ACXAEN_14745 [Candidatus Thorarchaeota archaeon]|jgi:hypothetical protein
MTCEYDGGWDGPCKKEATQEGFCSEHATTKCIVCREQAVRGCPFCGQFVCGYPLCAKRECYSSHDNWHQLDWEAKKDLPKGMVATVEDVKKCLKRVYTEEEYKCLWASKYGD